MQGFFSYRLNCQLYLVELSIQLEGSVYMGKWIILLILIGVVVFWLRKGRQQNPLIDPDVKELDQKRYYVTPTKKGDTPPDDHESTSL